MKWWRSRYVQHLEAENAELKDTIKRMLNPQWRYLLYGDTVPAIQDLQHKTPADDKTADKERVKLPGRKTWNDIRGQIEYMMSPQAIIDNRKKAHEEHIHAVTERIS